MPLQPAGAVEQASGQKLYGTGVGQPPADDQDQGDDGHGRMAESGEHLIRGHHADEIGGYETGESDQVVTETAPDEKAQNAEKQAEQEDLICGHDRLFLFVRIESSLILQPHSPPWPELSRR